MTRLTWCCGTRCRTKDLLSARASRNRKVAVAAIHDEMHSIPRRAGGRSDATAGDFSCSCLRPVMWTIVPSTLAVSLWPGFSLTSATGTNIIFSRWARSSIGCASRCLEYCSTLAAIRIASEAVSPAAHT
jgi:hypothetical protein